MCIQTYLQKVNKSFASLEPRNRIKIQIDSWNWKVYEYMESFVRLQPNLNLYKLSIYEVQKNNFYTLKLLIFFKTFFVNIFI